MVLFKMLLVITFQANPAGGAAIQVVDLGGAYQTAKECGAFAAGAGNFGNHALSVPNAPHDIEWDWACVPYYTLPK